ncbi:23S rRNA (uracil(1939)-C(5))-methyltransferase RlmD [Pantoea sp. 1.19]|uniref:23S rRNA (uracil(1939)-C(5))-methyltransferase RlmD n=1 Tax=Pantoea sp. 1.19 TaxID=1925589 RepID=UPI000948B57F|nr:23S rRNA (uracil(1939)-C(5))-methyltransferase RlmD [Pantoea sp. 1.19]
MAQFYSAKRRVTSRQPVTVTIESLDPFGQGVARHHGKTLFVRGALPGEQVEVTLEEDKRQFARGKASRILLASDQRVTPRCPHFGRCGGCQQQHAAPTLQQHSKTTALARLLSRETGQPIAAADIALLAGDPWGYRRRARLSLSWNSAQQRLEMGFRREGSHELVTIDRCPVLMPSLDALLVPLRHCLNSLAGLRQLGHVELVQADSGPLLVLRHLAALSVDDRQKLERFSHQHRLALFLSAQSDSLEQVCGERPWYRVGGVRLNFSPRDFIQVNREVNALMVDQAIRWLDLQPEDRVLDLFCGMGNFTLPIGNLAQNVTGVEGVAALVEMGRYNALQNNLQNVTFWHENLDADVTTQPWAAQGFTKVLLDPARAGAAGVMQQIVRLNPTSVVYVSCNAATLARDSRTLLQAGYHLDRVAMLDMFPHTGHLESMVRFNRHDTR